MKKNESMTKGIKLIRQHTFVPYKQNQTLEELATLQTGSIVTIRMREWGVGGGGGGLAWEKDPDSLNKFCLSKFSHPRRLPTI